MNEIVRVVNNEAVTDSIALAEGTGNKHKNVLELVRTYQSDLEEFGQLAFQTRVTSSHGAGQATEVALLNEHQATLLLTYMRNMPRIREFKKQLVKAFFAMADQLQRLAGEQSRRMLEGSRQVVRLERTFSASLKMAHKLGLEGAAAILEANRCTQEALGVDVLTDMGRREALERQATREERDVIDGGLSQFVMECCEVGREFFVRKEDLVAAYYQWARVAKVSPLPRGTLYRLAIGISGVRDGRRDVNGTRIRVFTGVCLKAGAA